MLVRKKNTDAIYAMKILKKEMVEMRNQKIHTLAERKIMEKVRSPFIVKLFFAFQSQEKLYLVMEYVPGGELFQFFKHDQTFTESQAKFYIAEILLALDCLHQNNIIYRDLKPQNVLIGEDGHIKITDFGLAKQATSNAKIKAYTFCGPAEYMAPEVIDGSGHDQTVDFWSLGALMYHMLAGKAPFYNPNKAIMLKNIHDKNFEILPTFSSQAVHLMRGLMCINPANRLGAKSLSEITGHPFFLGVNWDSILKKTAEPPFIPDLSNPDKIRIISVAGSELREPVREKLDSYDMSKGNTYEGFTYMHRVSDEKKQLIFF